MLSFKQEDVSVRAVPADDTRRIPDEIYNWKLVLCAVTAAAAAVIIGYDAGFIGGTIALSSFQREFGIDRMAANERTFVTANVVSVFQAGAFFGLLLMYPVGELAGRKAGLVISGFLLTFGAAISLIANGERGLAAIYAGRVLTGVGIGGCLGLAPIYVSEIAPAQIRGRLVGCWEVSWQVGGIIGYWINYGVLQTMRPGRQQWLIPFALQLVPSGLFFAGAFCIPESPRFLFARGQRRQAQANLSFLSNLPAGHSYLKREAATIERDIAARRRHLGAGFFGPILKVFTSRALLYRLALSTLLFPMQNGSGINAITYYSPTVFKSLGVSGTNAGLQSTGIFGLLKGFALVVWIFYIVDKVGRRLALIWGSIPCSLCMWFIGAYVKVADPAAALARGDTRPTPGGRAAQAMLYIWTLCYGALWNGTPWCINSEIFSQEIRTLTQAINSSSNWFWAFIWGRFTGEAFNRMGYGLYFLFAACMCVFPAVVYLLYPETKGVPLEAMDHLFEVPAWRARLHAMREAEEEEREAEEEERDAEEEGGIGKGQREGGEARGHARHSG